MNILGRGPWTSGRTGAWLTPCETLDILLSHPQKLWSNKVVWLTSLNLLCSIENKFLFFSKWCQVFNYSVSLKKIKAILRVYQFFFYSQALLKLLILQASYRIYLLCLPPDVLGSNDFLCTRVFLIFFYFSITT